MEHQKMKAILSVISTKQAFSYRDIKQARRIFVDKQTVCGTGGAEEQNAGKTDKEEENT